MINWFDLLSLQGTLKSLLQHHSSKASVLRHSAFFMVQLSHPHMTTGKTTLTIWNLPAHPPPLAHSTPQPESPQLTKSSHSVMSNSLQPKDCSLQGSSVHADTTEVTQQQQLSRGWDRTVTREVRSPCAWRGGARPGSRVTGGD